ncbi:MAG TPA: alpha/beta hydrolase [Acidimicrobiales bacterium]
MSELTDLRSALQRAAPDPAWDLPHHRLTYEGAMARLPVADNVEVVPTQAAGLDAEWLVPPGSRADATVLYLHGGGFTMGSLATARPLASRVAAASGLRVLTLDYRLAPENPHPAALDDAVDGLEWLRETEGGTISLCGDSAGAGLAISLALVARDRALPAPVAVACMSPWVDLALTGASVDTNASTDPQMPRWLLERFASMYAKTSGVEGPFVSPLHADLGGLPPLVVQVGTGEVLLDDAQRLVARVRHAGGDATIDRWDGCFHVFQAMSPMLPEADRAVTRLGMWLAEAAAVVR